MRRFLAGVRRRLRSDFPVSAPPSASAPTSPFTSRGSCFAGAAAPIRRHRHHAGALATTDPLTGLANHRAMVAAIDAEIERCRRFRQQCAVLCFEVDHFKLLNDVHGHAEGDRALDDSPRLRARSRRTIDVVGRFGGEEFVALLPQTSEPRGTRFQHPPTGS